MLKQGTLATSYWASQEYQLKILKQLNKPVKNRSFNTFHSTKIIHRLLQNYNIFATQILALEILKFGH